MDLLSQRTELHGFEKSYDPEGDGDCFYKAAAFQLRIYGTDLKNDLFDFLTENQYDPLGQNRLDFLCSDDVQNQDVPSDWNEALILLRNSWANEMVIRALCESLHCKITIITTSGDTPDSYIKVIAPSEQCGPPHHDLYFGHTGNHYFALTEGNLITTDKELPLQNIQPNKEDKEGTSIKPSTPGFDEDSDEWLELFSTLLNFVLPEEYLIAEMFWWQGIKKAKQSDSLWSREHMTGSRAEGLCTPTLILPEESPSVFFCTDLDLMQVKETFEIIGDEKIPIFDIIGERNDSRYVKLRFTEQWKTLHTNFDDSVFLQQSFLRSPASPGIMTTVLNAFSGMEEGDVKYEDILNIFQDEIHGPARKHVFGGENTFAISLDKTVVFEYPDAWPESAMDWLVRPRKSGWPSPELVEDIFDSGCHLAPVGRGRRASEPVEREEYLANPGSVSNTQSQQGEESLMDDVEWRSQSPVQRHIMVLLKIIKKVYLSDHDVISTYLLKNILFWECENRENDFWREDNSAKCLLSMMDRLEECLRKRHLPHYIMQDSNLLKYEDQGKLDKASKTVLEVRENIFQKTVNFLKGLQIVLFQSYRGEIVTDFSDSKRITNEDHTNKLMFMYSLCQRYKEVITDEQRNSKENVIKSEQILVSVQDVGLSIIDMMDQISHTSLSLSEGVLDALFNEIQKAVLELLDVDSIIGLLYDSHFVCITPEIYAVLLEPKLINSPGVKLVEYLVNRIPSLFLTLNPSTAEIFSSRFPTVLQKLFSVQKCHLKDFVNQVGILAKLDLSNISSLRLCVHKSLLARSYCKLWFAKNGKNSEHSKDREYFTLFVRNDIKSSPLDEEFIQLSLAFFDEMIVGRDSCEVVPKTTVMEQVKEIQESIARETVKLCKTIRLMTVELVKDNGVLYDLIEMMDSMVLKTKEI